MRDPDKNTTFSFYCYEHESVNLKIRLRYDGLKQSEFFRSLLLKYINNDPVMMSLVHDIKSEQKIMGKKKLKRTRDDYGVSVYKKKNGTKKEYYIIEEKRRPSSIYYTDYIGFNPYINYDMFKPENPYSPRKEDAGSQTINTVDTSSQTGSTVVSDTLSGSVL